MRDDNLLNALGFEKQWNGHDNFIKASSQFQEIYFSIIRDDAVDSRTLVRAEGEESQLRDAQSIFFLQTGDDEFVRDIWFFKHWTILKQIGGRLVTLIDHH